MENFRKELSYVDIGFHKSSNIATFDSNAIVYFDIQFERRSWGIKGVYYDIKELSGDFYAEYDNENESLRNEHFTYHFDGKILVLHNESNREYTVYRNVEVRIDYDSEREMTVQGAFIDFDIEKTIIVITV